ncbi:type II secretory pathway protein [Vibrio metschnikovii]|uniref:type II secretory pathway protein n=1 Tax=Vibrio metschnikovii TaxID=28172 RepID=UPI003317BBF4
MKKYLVNLSLFSLIIICAFYSSLSRANEQQVFETTNTPIAEFVSWYSRQTGLKILLGAGVTGSVSFTAPNLVPAEYPDFFNSVLRSHGYQLVKDGNSYLITINDEIQLPAEPLYLRLYRFQFVRNTKVAPLVTSILRSTAQQKEGQQQLNSVEVLPTTNTIIVTATLPQLEQIELILQGIDLPQRQVFVEAVITETEIGNKSELGVNLTAAFKDAGFSINTIAANRLKDNVFIFEGGDFNALVKAVASENNTALLSRPNMLVMDRERGYFSVGQNVPFLVASEVTSGGNSVQRIERRDVGVTLEIIPHVLGDQVVLQINQESSAVTNSTVASDIITNKRTLNTTVILQNGDTIVLGGLISTEKRDVETGVPVLKDIPLLGPLFRSTSTSDVNKELRMIIKTTVL